MTNESKRDWEVIVELEDMQSIYNIFAKHDYDAQKRMLEWLVRVLDEQNNKKQHELRISKIGNLMGDEAMKEKAK